MLSLPRKTLISCGFLPHGVGACQRGGKSSSPPSRTRPSLIERFGARMNGPGLRIGAVSRFRAFVLADARPSRDP